MADRYQNFEDLAAETQAGDDYRIRSEDRASSVVVIAPHGGTIEPETAKIAEEIAGSDFSFYAFEALKDGTFGDFHITSHRFDEPEALGLVSRASLAVAIHGRKNDGTDTVWLGGRADELREVIGAGLRGAGFAAELNTTLPGLHETNICNRTLSGTGVQLELPRSLRRKLAQDADLLDSFCLPIRDALLSASAI